MSYGYLAPITGTFTSNGTSQTISGLPNDLIKFEVWNESEFGLNSSNTRMLEAYWFKDMAAGSAFVRNRTSGAYTEALTTMITTNGFTFIDPTSAQLQAALTGSAISSANPGVVTSTNTGTLQNGDVIRVYKTTGLLQIAGMDFSVGSVSANTNFTLAYLDTTQTNLTGGASAITYQKLNFQSAYYPRRRNIVNIEASSGSSIITMAVAHGFTVGQAVRIYVPSNFVGSGTNPFTQVGSTGNQNNPPIVATITAINAADASGITNTITVNVNSANFTWQWPTSATAAAGMQFAFVEPVGEAATTSAGSTNPANLLDDATVNQGTYQMVIGSSVVGVNTNTIRWIATRGLILS